MYRFIIYSRKSRNAQDGHVQHTHRTNDWQVKVYLEKLEEEGIEYEIVGSYEENISGGGYYTKRPIFRKIIEQCKADKSLTLLVAKADRLARNVRSGTELMETINFVLANAPDADDMQKQLEFVIAEREWKNTSDRYRATNRAKKARCEAQGIKCIWGGNSEKWKKTYTANQAAGLHKKSHTTFTRSENTLPLVDKLQSIAALFNNLITSNELSDKLNAAGVLTTTGKQWTGSSVRKFAKRYGIVYNTINQKV